MTEEERNGLIIEGHALIDSVDRELKYIVAKVLLKRANQLLEDAYQDHLISAKQLMEGPAG
jgi:hypothetical protein|tara:strand:+ start:21816 stop:21998 length:183 start_codon:yes stop_codon:yes gene_type:complete